jgi:integrase
LRVLRAGKAATNNYLRRLHNLALGLGWLAWPILAPRAWPKVRSKPKRGITWEEHALITSAEKNLERRLYYELLWETGAAQSDAAHLTGANIDWASKTITYQRKKLDGRGEPASVRIGERLEKILRQLPTLGPLFPKIRQSTEGARSSEFCRRCRILKITGVSLHSYRYAWAERAKSCGYPERYAQSALGHNSKAVHQAYARNSKVICPPLEEYEKKVIPWCAPGNAQAAEAVV